jgi:ABC-type bacteriocin/lantibiotic exporter with double-glycine peptidase domain
MKPPRTIFHVPAVSQFLDVPDKDWRDRSCGIASLASVMGFWNGKVPPLAPLIEEGLSCGAYTEGIGWRHRGIVELAEQRGLQGKNFDWSKEPMASARNKLEKMLSRGPVIASIRNGNSGHLVVLTGMQGDKIFYNEPAAKKRNAIMQSTDRKSFFGKWKKRAIFVAPPTGAR